MPIHGVLIEGDEQVDPVTHIGDFIRAGANRQERMTASNYGLIGVVGIQIKAAPTEDFCEDVAWSSHTLSGRSPNADREGLLHTPPTRVLGAHVDWEWQPS